MRIAFVLDNMIYGGIERVAINYMEILVKQGHEIDVIILNSKVDEIVNEIPKQCNVIYTNFTKMFCPEAYWTVAKKYKLGKYIFPIVYFLLMILTPIFRIFKGRRGKYDRAIAFSGHYNDLTYVANYIKADKRYCWLHGGLTGYLLISPGFYFLYKKIKNLVVLSKDYQENAMISNNLDDCNITRIYNPVSISNRPLDLSKIEKLKKIHGEFLLMVGRFSPQKDQITVINVIKILKTKYKRSIKVLFVGDGPTKKIVEKYASDCEVSDLVIFEGKRSDVQNYYKAAKIFVHSSPSEGLPTVLLEAMSFGVPIVATDSRPGVREILGENEYGLISPIKNPEIMALNINKLLSDNKLYEDYIEKGYKRIEDFNPEVISKQLKVLLNDV
ncbi:glycosyltransferase [Neobacillus thermocopriae]|uniref:glycosyltransferase n=1 Tax=Neobacillus thermocopriae TaxID=1215031 RepID=UPI002E1A40BA|nr:glycosyltransferase [Neobacillus thermocopriae]MED3713384.1 glycosyltransferase [Neobacillus thermocopriae]